MVNHNWPYSPPLIIFQLLRRHFYDADVPRVCVVNGR